MYPGLILCLFSIFSLAQAPLIFREGSSQDDKLPSSFIFNLDGSFSVKLERNIKMDKLQLFNKGQELQSISVKLFSAPQALRLAKDNAFNLNITAIELVQHSDDPVEPSGIYLFFWNGKKMFEGLNLIMNEKEYSLFWESKCLRVDWYQLSTKQRYSQFYTWTDKGLTKSMTCSN